MFHPPSGTFNTNYAADMAIVRTKAQWVLSAVCLSSLFVFPLFAPTYYVSLLSLFLILIVVVTGLNITTGLCGQLSLAHAAFMGVGAYTFAILANYYGVSFWVCLLVGGIAAGLVGSLFGFPAFRVKGLYLILATLAAQFIITWVIRDPAAAITGGTYGTSVPSPRLGGITFGSTSSYYYIVVTITIVMILFAKNLSRSKVGRAFVAIRDNDLAAELTSINLYRYKFLAFFIGCFFAGVAGVLWGPYLGRISVQHFGFMDSIWYIGMLIVGGMGSTLGPIFGVVFLMGLRELITALGPSLAGVIPIIGANICSSLVLIIFALVVSLFLVFEPRGLTHRWEIIKCSYRFWPFSY